MTNNAIEELKEYIRRSRDNLDKADSLLSNFLKDLKHNKRRKS